jgi:hypothetical protein
MSKIPARYFSVPERGSPGFQVNPEWLESDG